MLLIITDYIKKHELKYVAKYFTTGDIKKSIGKIASSGINMSTFGYKDCKVVKVHIGSKPSGRMIIYIQIKKDYYFPVILRLKKDKVFGKNLSLQNKKAEQKIAQNLRKILKDVKQGHYEKFEM